MKQINLFNEILKFDLDKDASRTDHFMIRTIPGLSGMPSNYLHPHSHNYFCISLLYQGKAGHELRAGSPFVQGPAVLLLEKDEVHVHSFEPDCQLISLCISPEFMERENMPWNSILNRVFFRSVVLLTEAQLKDFHQYFSLLVYEYQRHRDQETAITANLLMIIFKMITEIKIETNDSECLPPSRLSYFEFKTLIDRQFRQHHYVQTYADQLCMTAEMLGKVVKDTVNKTPKQLIDDRLITEAKRMLTWTKTSNKEIAHNLGFESDSYFNRYFKKHCHQTPLSFRQQLQK